MPSKTPSLNLQAALADMHKQHAKAWRSGELKECDLLEIEMTELSERLWPIFKANPTLWTAQ